MPQGLQCWNENGVLTLDYTERITRYFNTIITGNIPGSYTDSRLSEGTPWYFLRAIENNDYAGIYEQNAMYITISGNTIKWNWVVLNNNTTKFSKKIIYGVY